MSKPDNLPEPDVSNVRGAAVVCVLAKPRIKVCWGPGKTGLSGVTVTLTRVGGDEPSTCSFAATDGGGQAPWGIGAGVPAGQYTVTLAGCDTTNAYEQTTAEVALAQSFTGEKEIILKKLARPGIEAVWGPALANKAGGVKVRVTKALAHSDFGPTAVGGTAALATLKGLDPGQYTVTLPEPDDQKAYTLVTATVTLTEGQTHVPPVRIELKKLARPKIRVVDSEGKGVRGIPVKLVSAVPLPPGPPPPPPALEYLFGETRRSGTAERAAADPGLPPGPYTIALAAGTYEPTLVSPSAVTLAEGTTEVILARVTMAKGALLVELNRNDGESVKPIGVAVNVVVAINRTGSVAADHNLVEIVSPVVKESGRSVSVKKAACELKALTPGDYVIELKDILALRNAQLAVPLVLVPPDPAWNIGPNSTGKITVKIEAGKTATTTFTLSSYKKAQFIGFNILPGTIEGYTCVTCGSFAVGAGICSADASHGARREYACFRCSPAQGADAGGDCAVDHFKELSYLCDTCLKVAPTQGVCPLGACGGNCWPYCGACKMWFGNTTCVTCGGAGAARRIPVRPVSDFEAHLCPHAAVVTFPAALALCVACKEQYVRAANYRGLDNAEQDLGGRCLIMKKAIETAYGNAVIDKTAAGNDTLKIFMAPEFYFRNTAGGYPVELISSILEQMRDEVADVKYKDWLFVYGSAIGFLKHESATPTGEPELPLRITQVLPGAPIRLHVVGRNWAGTNVCERIPKNNGTLAALCQWKIKQGASTFVVNSYKRVAGVAAEVELTAAGVLDVMALKWRIGTGAWTAVTSKANHAYVFAVPGHACTLAFPPANYVLGSTYSIALNGTVTGTGAHGVIARDRGVMAEAIEVEITTAGTLGTMAFKWRPGTAAYSAPVISTANNPFTMAIPELGQRLSFAAGNYTMPGAYTIAANGAVTAVSGINNVTASSLCGVSCPRTTTPAAEEYEIEVSGGAWTGGDCDLLEPKATEVFNVALVQKGGSDAGVSSLRELLVYKEYVSPIDFIAPYKGWWHKPSGAGRMARLHGEMLRLTLPTSGSRDKLAVNPNTGDERTITGLGGGSVFTLDGITFGLEVCLDHAENRLHSFYTPAPPAGTPKVQIHLIPSWGMSIDDGNRCGVTNTLIFNVDGPEGSSAGKLTDPTVPDPDDDNAGHWDDLTGAVTDVPFLPLPTADWDIKVVNPASLNRGPASPPPAPAGPFALIAGQIPAKTMGDFFEPKTSGGTLADFGNIKIYAAERIPNSETV